MWRGLRIGGFTLFVVSQPIAKRAEVRVDVQAPNKQIARFRLYALLLALDSVCILLTFGTIGALLADGWRDLHFLKLVAMVLPIYLFGAIYGNVYSLDTLKRPTAAAVQAATLMFVTMLAVQSVLFFADASGRVERLPFAAGMAICALLLAAVRHPFSRFALRVTDGALTNDILIVDGVDMPPVDGLHTVDAVVNQLQPDLNDPYMLNRLGQWLHNFDRVLIACPPERRTDWRMLLQGANIQGEIVTPDSSLQGVIGVGQFQGRPTMVVSKGPLTMTNRLKKRLFDLALTAPALVLLSPVMLLIAIAIKLESPGPIFFRQDRVGRSNRLFKIMKFRSMRTELTDHSGAVSASLDDKRITRVGAIIRRTSIDELPQLINVLKGDMSLVGPRPHALGSTAGDKLFWEVSQSYWCRHSLKPGITGLAQIRGFRGATSHPRDLENRLQADLEYIRDWSFMREVVILLGTLRVVIHKNAY